MKIYDVPKDKISVVYLGIDKKRLLQKLTKRNLFYLLEIEVDIKILSN